MSAAAELDPRIERSRRVIAEATIAEMAEVGYGSMTIEGVAKRAGVSKATIYRQWKNKLDLVAGALDMIKDDMHLDESAPPRVRLTELLTWLAEYLGDDENAGAACMPMLVSAAQYDPAVREFHHRFSSERRQVLIDILVDGQATSDFDCDLDPALTAELLVGPLFYRRLMSGQVFPTNDVPALIDAVLGSV
jgi:TetR/AcrR family transcriptional regulator of autoinduction and epiphytic fitness